MFYLSPQPISKNLTHEKLLDIYFLCISSCFLYCSWMVNYTLLLASPFHQTLTIKDTTTTLMKSFHLRVPTCTVFIQTLKLSS